MNIVVSAGTFWFRSFPEALDLIAGAGGTHVEVALYWARDKWERGQHLKGVSPRAGLAMVAEHGLVPSNIHNVGGLSLTADEPARHVFDEDVKSWIVEDLPQCLVFHLPHLRSETPNPAWWETFEQDWIDQFRRFEGEGRVVTAENLQPVPGYYFPVLQVEELRRFVDRHNLYLTFDTTQCLQAGFDLYRTAEYLSDRIANLHLSEYWQGRPHGFIGEGDIDWPRFFNCLDRDRLFSVTLECTMSTPQKKDVEMTSAELVDRLRLALDRVKNTILCSRLEIRD